MELSLKAFFWRDKVSYLFDEKFIQAQLWSPSVNEIHVLVHLLLEFIKYLYTCQVDGLHALLLTVR